MDGTVTTGGVEAGGMLFERVRLADGRHRDVLIHDGTIERIAEPGEIDAPDEQRIAGENRHLLPGMIDAHVHFRQPGDSHKETWATGSRAAAAGGVTTVVDQPNTDPPTVTGTAFDRKRAFTDESLVEYGLSGGVTPDWEPEALFDRPVFALGEVFLADSTGSMGIDTALFRAAADRAASAGVVCSVHAEDAEQFDPDALIATRSNHPGDATGSASDTGETGQSAEPTGADDADETAVGRAADGAAWSRYRPATAEAAAVETAIDTARDTGVSLHIAHTSTPEAVELITDARDSDETPSASGESRLQFTCEVTPHHLFLSQSDATRLGTYGRMNPPLRSEARRAAMFDALRDGRIDCVATDHAPHTREEKNAPLTDAPSGVPGVETALPLLLAAVTDDRLSLDRVRDVTARNPARIFGLPTKGEIAVGRDADLTLVDLTTSRTITGDELHSNCGWTPFAGHSGVFPDFTLVRGQVVYDRHDAVIDGPFGPAVGENVRPTDEPTVE